jgi:hypothetical protein
MEEPNKVVSTVSDRDEAFGIDGDTLRSVESCGSTIVSSVIIRSRGAITMGGGEAGRGKLEVIHPSGAIGRGECEGYGEIAKCGGLGAWKREDHLPSGDTETASRGVERFHGS